VDIPTLLSPGTEMIKIRAVGGNWYELPFRSVSYRFADTTYATIVAGDEEYEEEEEQEDQKTMTQRLSNRRSTAVIWRPYTS